MRISVSHLKEQLEALCKEEMEKIFDKGKNSNSFPSDSCKIKSKGICLIIRENKLNK